MSIYYDTGLLLKLYTIEPESSAVRQFVISRGDPLPFHSFHRTECASALHLKVFRKECTLAQANRALADIEEDIGSGVLQETYPNWDKTWVYCLELSRSHAAFTGCRTLDTLHIACASILGFREFATSDRRQASMADRIGMRVQNPT